MASMNFPELDEIIQRQQRDVEEVNKCIKDSKQLTHALQASLGDLSEIILKHDSSNIEFDHEPYKNVVAALEEARKMENDKEYFKEKIKGKAWKDEGIGRSPANFEEQKSAQKLPMKKAPSDPFGNLEEMILGKEETETRDITIDENTDIFSSRSKAKINQEESRGDLFDKPEANLDDIIEHLTKIMKPFDKKKAEKKVPSRIKISKYLLDCKNDAVKESSDESKIKKICKYIANYSLDVYSSNLKGIHQMLYFETIEMMKNDYIELSFQNYMESNPKFDTFLNNLFSRARNFMGELQEKLNKRNDQSSDTQSSSSKDDPLRGPIGVILP